MLSRRISKEKRQGRISAEIARRIYEEIANGGLSPGEKLPAERDLAQRMKVSRVSVREAYRSLAELGILTIRRGAEGGAFIADVDHEPVKRSLSLLLRLARTSFEELTEARVLLEPAIARLAAERADAESVKRLDAMLRKQEEMAREQRDPHRYDLHFHRLVAECTRNLPLMMVMNSVADLALETIAQMDLTNEVNRHGLELHAQIANAIRKRDGDTAYQTMLSHVEEVQSDLTRALARRTKRSSASRRRSGSRSRS